MPKLLIAQETDTCIAVQVQRTAGVLNIGRPLLWMLRQVTTVPPAMEQLNIQLVELLCPATLDFCQEQDVGIRTLDSAASPRQPNWQLSMQESEDPRS